MLSDTRARRRPLYLVFGILVVSEFAYLAMFRLDAVSSAKSVFSFLALLALLFLCYGFAYYFLRPVRDSRAAAILIVFGALLFRCTLLFAGLPHDSTAKEAVSAAAADIRGKAVTYDRFLLYDNDIWRYLWDGHVWASGANPYLYEPDNPRLDALSDSESGANPIWGDIRDNVNHPQVPTIYPPVAELIFRFSHLLAPGSVLAMKAIFVAFDLLAMLFVGLTLRALRRPWTETLLYAWNPLLIKTVAGSGHMDAIVAAALAGTAYFMIRGSRICAAMLWSVSVLAKLSPLVLLPFVARRLGWRRTSLGIGLIVLGYVPFLSAGKLAFAGMMAFARSWQFNAGFFSLMQWLARHVSNDPALLAKGASGIVFLLVLATLVRKDDANYGSFAWYSATALGALILLGPTVMPWYLIWLLPLAAIAGARIWIHFSVLVCLAFVVMINGTLSPEVLFLEYGALFVLVCRTWLQFKRKMQAEMSGSMLRVQTVFQKNTESII